MRNLVWAVAAALAGMTSAQANDLSYSYAEAGFGVVDFDVISEEGDGFFLGGSLGFGTNWLGFVEYGMSSFDVQGADADVDELQLGFGGHFPLSSALDFVGKLAYVDQSIDVSTQFGSASADENGYMLSLGLRGMAVERLDLMGAIEYVDMGDSGDDTGLALRGLYHFTDMFSLGARIDTSDDVTQYGVFGRFTF